MSSCTSLRCGRLVQRAFQFLTSASKLLQNRGREGPTMEEAKKGRFSAGPLTFAVRHELWDGNIQDHPDQGVAIQVLADVAGKETALLRFNCFDFERSYVYGPENADLLVDGPAMLGGAAATTRYRSDSAVGG